MSTLSSGVLEALQAPPEKPKQPDSPWTQQFLEGMASVQPVDLKVLGGVLHDGLFYLESLAELAVTPQDTFFAERAGRPPEEIALRANRWRKITDIGDFITKGVARGDVASSIATMLYPEAVTENLAAEALRDPVDAIPPPLRFDQVLFESQKPALETMPLGRLFTASVVSDLANRFQRDPQSITEGEVNLEFYERSVRAWSEFQAKALTLIPGTKVNNATQRAELHPVISAMMATNPAVRYALTENVPVNTAAALATGGDIFLDPLLIVDPLIKPLANLGRFSRAAAEVVKILPWNTGNKVIKAGEELVVASDLAKRAIEARRTILPKGSKSAKPLSPQEEQYLIEVMQRHGGLFSTKKGEALEQLADYVAPRREPIVIKPTKAAAKEAAKEAPKAPPIDQYMRDEGEDPTPLLENLKALDKQIRNLEGRISRVRSLGRNTPEGDALADAELAARNAAKAQVKQELRTRFPGKILARDKKTGAFSLVDAQITLTPPDSRVVDKYLRGPNVIEENAARISQAAGLTPEGEFTSVDRAAALLREGLIPPLRMGEAVLDADLMKQLSPTQRGKRLLEYQVPGLSEAAKAFFESGPIAPHWGRTTETGELIRGLLPAPNTTSAILKEPADVGRLGNVFGTSQWIFNDPRNPIARGMYNTWRRAREDGHLLLQEIQQVFSPMEKVISKAGRKGRTTLFANMLRFMNAPPGKAQEAAGKLLSKEERIAGEQARAFFETALQRNPQLLDDAVSSAAAARVPDEAAQELIKKQILEEFGQRGLIEQLGFVLWRNEDFLTRTADGKLRRAIPPELADMENPEEVDSLIHLFQHLYAKPGGKVPGDLVETLRATFAGLIRKTIHEPAWQEMEKAVPNLPPRARASATAWIKNLRGVPPTMFEVFYGRVRTARERARYNFAVSATDELSGILLEGAYRGGLIGNRSHFFANFFGQGFANEAATNGPFAAFEGIANHYRAALAGEPQAGGLPREAIMGSFEALFGKELPQTRFGKQLAKLPGAGTVRKFWRGVESQGGPSASEYLNRSIGMHVGLKDALDKYNWRNRQANPAWVDVTVRDLMSEGVVHPDVRNNLLFEALLHSERINFVYGIEAGNPHVNRAISRGPLALLTQFMSYFPKQAEFLMGPLIKEGDAGVFMRYLMVSGWLARVTGEAWGIDYTSSFVFGSLPRKREGIPLPMPPAPQMAWLLFSSMFEKDPLKQKRSVEELHRTMGLFMVPGYVQLERDRNFVRTLFTHRLLTPGEWPKELIDVWGPTAAEQRYPFGEEGGFYPTDQNLKRSLENILRSETPGRALGTPVLSDRVERRLNTEIARSNRIFRAEALRITDELIKEIQLHGMDTEKFDQLIAEAGRQGIPLGGALREGLLGTVLPRLQRTFLDSPGLSKAAYIDLIHDMYSEMWDNPAQVPPTLSDDVIRNLQGATP